MKKVQFKGSSAEPEIVVSGKYLDATPPTPTYPPGPCRNADRGSFTTSLCGSKT